MLALQLWQGGNRLGNLRNTTVAKKTPPRFQWIMTSEDGSFKEVHLSRYGRYGFYDSVMGFSSPTFAKNVDEGQAGYQKLPKGRYVITQTQREPWKDGTPDSMKELTFGLSSHVPTVMKYL